MAEWRADPNLAVRSSQKGLSSPDAPGSTGHPRDERRQPTPPTAPPGTSREGPLPWGRSAPSVHSWTAGPGGSALRAGVVFDEGEPELFELVEQALQSAVVVEEDLVVGELLVGQKARDRLLRDLAGPRAEGPVQAWRCPAARAGRLAAASLPHDDATGEAGPDRLELRLDARQRGALA